MSGKSDTRREEKEEYCVQHMCAMSDTCRHYLKGKDLEPEEAFGMHSIEERECVGHFGYERYWPTEEAKG
ncbi:hypothetical protein [Hydrogenimonas sp.]